MIGVHNVDRRQILRRFAGNLGLQGGVTVIGAGMVVRIIAQSGYFLVTARALGPHQYGLLVTTVALVSVVAPFATMGMGGVVILWAQRCPEKWRCVWRISLRTTATVGGALMLGILLIARTILPSGIPLLLIIAICTSELLLARFADLGAAAFQGHEHYVGAAVLPLIYTMGRFLAVAMIAALARLDLTWLALAYLASSLAACVVGLGFTNAAFGKRSLEKTPIGGLLRVGGLFSVSLAAQSVYNDIDKTMLGVLASPDAAGLYTVAYKLVDFSFTPTMAFLTAIYPRFFRAGAKGLSSGVRFARRVCSATLALGCFGSASLIALSYTIGPVFGSRYVTAAGMVRALSVLPLAKSLHYLAADTLTGSDRQGSRSMCQMFVAVFNVGLNMWLIPAFGYHGAIVSSIISDCLLACLLWAVVRFLLAGDRQYPNGNALGVESAGGAL
ncbi:MAG TPA: oligosaccharide flippase family protein [Acidimicrobiales bacterium]|nr:oligosaccharide flippase family protein [Acidimicrobiales bacterium]